MKSLLLLLLALIGQSSFGQYRIDSSVKNEFDSLYQQQKEGQKKSYTRLFKTGVSFLTYLKEDTLNINDFKAIIFDMPIKVPDSTIIDKTYPPDQNKEYKKIWFECAGKFGDDTLFIFSHFGFFGGVDLGIKIFQTNTLGLYSEYEKDWFQYRHTLNDSPSNYIQVNARFENLILSEKPNINSKKIYGNATFITDPFYEDNERFKTGYILKRYRINYFFSCDIDKAKK